MAKEERVQAVAAIPSDQFVNQAVEHINDLIRQTAFKSAVEIGDYILKAFFDSDFERVSSHNLREDASFRTLADRCDKGLQVSEMFLADVVGVAVMCKLLPEGEQTYKQLSHSHQTTLLSLRDPQLVEEMAERVVKQKLPLNKLRKLVQTKLESKSYSPLGRSLKLLILKPSVAKRTGPAVVDALTEWEELSRTAADAISQLVDPASARLLVETLNLVGSSRADVVAAREKGRPRERWLLDLLKSRPEVARFLRAQPSLGIDSGSATSKLVRAWMDQGRVAVAHDGLGLALALTESAPALRTVRDSFSRPLGSESATDAELIAVSVAAAHGALVGQGNANVDPLLVLWSCSLAHQSAKVAHQVRVGRLSHGEGFTFLEDHIAAMAGALVASGRARGKTVVPRPGTSRRSAARGRAKPRTSISSPKAKKGDGPRLTCFECHMGFASFEVAARTQSAALRFVKANLQAVTKIPQSEVVGIRDSMRRTTGRTRFVNMPKVRRLRSLWQSRQAWAADQRQRARARLARRIGTEPIWEEDVDREIVLMKREAVEMQRRVVRGGEATRNSRQALTYTRVKPRLSGPFAQSRRRK